MLKKYFWWRHHFGTLYCTCHNFWVQIFSRFWTRCGNLRGLNFAILLMFSLLQIDWSGNFREVMTRENNSLFTVFLKWDYSIYVPVRLLWLAPRQHHSQSYPPLSPWSASLHTHGMSDSHECEALFPWNLSVLFKRQRHVWDEIHVTTQMLCNLPLTSHLARDGIFLLISIQMSILPLSRVNTSKL